MTPVLWWKNHLIDNYVVTKTVYLTLKANQFVICIEIDHRRNSDFIPKQIFTVNVADQLITTASRVIIATESQLQMDWKLIRSGNSKLEAAEE